LPLAIAFICGGAFWYLPRTPAAEMSGLELAGSLAVFSVLIAALCFVSIKANRLYRCPRCNSVPMGTWSTLGPGSFGLHSGVALNPKRCGNCGAILREQVDA
jgi:hypothetical protein